MGILGVAILAATLPGADAAGDSLQRFESTRIRMGVPITITVYAPREEAANTAISAAFARIKELNDLLSDYDPDSELMRLCRDAKPGQPVRVSPELFLVLSRADDLSRRSSGAFDVTVGPVVQLWRKARRAKKLPGPAELAAATALVGYQKIKFDAEHRTVELLQPGMRLDLGGIAKGYAADEAAAVLREKGLTRVLVAVSGDIVAGDPPPGKTGWRIGVGPVDNPDGAPRKFLSLANMAVSTAGDAFQHVEIDGKRYSHLVDPRTGQALTRRSSVTAVAPRGITSDAVDSTLYVLGAEKGLKLVADLPKVEVYIVELDEAGHRSEHSTEGFAKFVIAD